MKNEKRPDARFNWMNKINVCYPRKSRIFSSLMDGNFYVSSWTVHQVVLFKWCKNSFDEPFNWKKNQGVCKP